MANKYTATATSGNYIGIPANILTVHTNDVIFSAMPVMRYDQFAVVRTDLQVQRGGTISFSKYANLTRGGIVLETGDIETKEMSATSVNITVNEYGNAVGITSKFMTLSFMDEMQNAATLLGRDYAIVTDSMLRDALFSGTQVKFAGGRTLISDILSTDTLNKAEVDGVVETLATGNSLKMADANGEYYVCFAHPHQTRYLKADLISVRQYAFPELIFKGEVGEYNGVRFIETSNVPNGAVASTEPGYDATLVQGYDTGGAVLMSADVYKCAFFGERAYGWAIATPVELREDPGTSNYGRRRGIAWYAIMGAGVIVDANICILVTG